MLSARSSMAGFSIVTVGGSVVLGEPPLRAVKVDIIDRLADGAQHKGTSES